jgi:CRISPR-associated protein Cas1
LAVLYVAEQGSTLRKESERIVVVRDGETIATIPVRVLDSIVLFGNINLTTPMLAYLLHSDVDCVFCSSDGRYRGGLVASESGFGELRRLQLKASIESERCLEMACSIVRGKLLNQRTILLRNARVHEAGDCADAAQSVASCLDQIEAASSLAELRGLEGQGAVSYFTGFRSLLQETMGFERRARRPPPDPVNSLLSFGYTLLAKDVLSVVCIVGLDPHIGFLHAARHSSPSLALDLAEEFRPVLVDSLVLQVLNSRIIVPSDFERRGEPEGVFLTREGLPKFLGQYERRLLTKVKNPQGDEEVTYRRLLELQVRALAAVLQNRVSRYRPYLVK